MVVGRQSSVKTLMSTRYLANAAATTTPHRRHRPPDDRRLTTEG
jgi:hypothetical protein